MRPETLASSPRVELELNQLQWRAVRIPAVALAVLLTLTGLLAYLLDDTWDVHILLAHFLLIGLVTVGTFWFVTHIFRAIRHGHEETLRRSAALVDAERRFRAIIEHSADVTLVLDANGAVRYASPSVTRVLGYSPDELLDRLLLNLVNGADRDAVHGRFSAREQQRQGFVADTVRVHHKDGSWRWLELVADSLVSDPVVQGIVWNARDITKRKAAEDALEEQMRLARLSTLVGNTLTGTEVLEVSLQRCADALTATLDAVLVRIWTLHEQSQTLRLCASAGSSHGVDDPAACIPVGEGMVGLIARDRRPHVTHDVPADADIHERASLGAEALVGFAGYPLVEGDRFVGVLAVYARRPLSEAALQTLVSVADQVALHIQRHRADDALWTAHHELERRVSDRTQALAAANAALQVEVSERRRTEAELQSLFDGVPVGLYRTSPTGQVLRANPALLSTLGCQDLPLLLSTNIRDLYVDPAARAEWLAAMERYGSVRAFEVELHRFDGRRIWIRHSGRAIRGPDGAITHFEGVAEDVTERKRADVALRESQARLAGIVGSVIDGIVTMDSDQQIVFFNAAAEKIFRCPAVNAVGQPVKDFIPEWEQLDGHEIARSFDDLVGLRGRNAVRREVIGLRSNGEDFPCEVSISRVQVHAQRLYTIVARDITTRKRATRDLERSREMLRSLATHVETVREEERRAVAREIHDELGQALTGLKIDLAWLTARLPEEPATLRDKASGMLQLMDATVQSVRRLASSLRPGILDDLGLGPAIEWQTQEFQTRTGIQCQCDANTDGLPLNPEQSTAMFRILQESLTNVVRHANATRVQVTLRHDATRLTLQVADNGQGITAEEQANRKSLGLLGMRERARLHGGGVTFAGQSGRGTLVEAWIPLQVQVKEEPTPNPGGPAPDPEPANQG